MNPGLSCIAALGLLAFTSTGMYAQRVESVQRLSQLSEAPAVPHWMPGRSEGPEGNSSFAIECRGRSRSPTIALQTAGGLAGGAVGIGAAAIATLAIASGRYAATTGGTSTDLDRIIEVIAYPSYVLGSAVGVHWVGGRRGYRGRFLLTLVGSTVGIGAPGAVAAYHISDSRRKGALPCP